MTENLAQWTRILIGGWRELTRRWRIALVAPLLAIFAFTSLVQWIAMNWVHHLWGEHTHYAIEVLFYGLFGPLFFLLFISGVFFRWRAERQRAERHLAAVVNSSADAIVSVDTLGKIHSWNRGAETIFGYRAEEALEQSLEQLLDSGLGWPANASRWETVLRARDQREIPVEVSSSLLADEGGDQPMRVLIIRDVTERRRREQAVQEERARIARDLHDGVQQDLFLAGIKLDICRQLLQGDSERVDRELLAIRETIQDEITDLQRIVRALRPLELEHFGLMSAVRRLAVEYAKQNQAAVDFSLQGPERDLPYEVEAALYRVVQEALNNVAKHAQAQRVWLKLDLSDPQEVLLIIRDDGRGFDAQTLLTDSAPHAGLGLRHMRERVEERGGTFAINSVRGRGTTLEVRIPLGVPPS